MTTATVKLWGTTVGYVSMGTGEPYARFEYDPNFVNMDVELAPVHMPTKRGTIYQFRDLHPRSFHGMPGLLADSLPDKFGNSLINIWLARTGRNATGFNAVDRLCYTGQRGMGALEFEPINTDGKDSDTELHVAELTELASMAFSNSEVLDARLAQDGTDGGLLDILKVGTSAGGARAKAVIAYNPKTREVRSGQIGLKPGFEHWLIKFDGVQFNGDWGVADPAGYGLLEYSYYETAKACGINMMECRVFSENGRNHFMTRRFDREENGRKKFVQTFAALEHFDYYESGQYAYEQLFHLMRKLHMSKADIEEQFRRVVFNLVGCNQDDHVKNFSFMMDREGQWSISPAYDLCHSEGSDFTRNHQLRLCGKVNGFDRSDLKELARFAGLARGAEKRILDQTLDAFNAWAQLAGNLGVPQNIQDHVQRTLRLNW